MLHVILEGQVKSSCFRRWA